MGRRAAVRPYHPCPTRRCRLYHAVHVGASHVLQTFSVCVGAVPHLPEAHVVRDVPRCAVSLDRYGSW